MIDVKVKKKNLFNTSYIGQPNVPTREEFHQKIAHPVLTYYDFETGKRNSMKNEAERVSSDYMFAKMNTKKKKDEAGNWLLNHDSCKEAMA